MVKKDTRLAIITMDKAEIPWTAVTAVTSNDNDVNHFVVCRSSDHDFVDAIHSCHELEGKPEPPENTVLSTASELGIKRKVNHNVIHPLQGNSFRLFDFLLKQAAKECQTGPRSTVTNHIKRNPWQ